MAIIRQATREDIPCILELYQELTISYSQIEASRHPSKQDYEQTLDRINAIPGYQLLVAEEEGEVVGLMEFLIIPNISHHNSPWALIEGLVVNSQHRQRGLGKMLMQYALQKARDAAAIR